MKATPNYQSKTSYNFNVTSSDGTLSSTQAVTLNVTDVAPTIAATASTVVVEGTTPGTAVYTATANSVVGSAITYSLTGADASAFRINATTGVISIAPLQNLNYQLKSIYNLNVVASDGTLSSTQSLTVNITDTAPVINSTATATISEGTPAIVPVFTASATDVTGTTITYSLGGADANLFNINSLTGVVTLKAVANFATKPTYNFNVIASDGTLTSAEAVTLSVADVAPIITPVGAAITSEGTAPGTAVYTASATSIGGHPLTYSLTGADASAFVINATTGVISVAPSQVLNYQLKSFYSFNVVVSDGVQSSAEALTVSLTDTAPVINSVATTSVAEGTPITTPVFTASATDVSGTTLTYSLSGLDANFFNINSATGAVTLKAVADYQTKSSYSFSVLASDGTLTSAEAVTLNVTDVAPTITATASTAVLEGTTPGTAIYTASASSVVGSAVTYSLSGADASAFTINATTGVVSVAIGQNLNFQTKPSYNFSIVASDGTLSSTQALTVNLTDKTPVINSTATTTVTEGTSITTPVFTASATDVSGTTLTYSLSGADANLFNINTATGAVTLKAPANYQTKPSYSFSVTASDGTLTSTEAVSLNVTDVAPTIPTTGTTTVVEGTAPGTAIYTASASSVVGSAITYSLSGADASAFTINATTGVISVATGKVLNYQLQSTYHVNVVASDGTMTSAQALTVNLTDTAPIINSAATASVVEGSPLSTVVFTPTATDVSGTTLTYSLSGADALLFNINSSTGAVTLKLVANYQLKPSYNFNVVASDGTLTSSEAVTLNVTDVPPAIAANASTSVVEGTTAGTPVYVANATSVVGSTITYALAGADASAFTINATTGVISIAPSQVLNYQLKPTYTLTVIAEDGTAQSLQTLTVNITDLAPVINSVAVSSVIEGSPTSTPVFTASATDISGTVLTYTLSGSDANLFNINSTTGAVTLKAPANYQTQPIYHFNVTASDGSLSSVQAVTLNVTDVAPVMAATASTTVAEGTAPGSAVYTASAASVVGSSITYSLTGLDASAFTINATTGVISIAPNAVLNYQLKSAYNFTVLASDGTDTSIQALRINVTDTAPVINAATTTSVVEGTSVLTPVFNAVATDVSGTTLTYSLSGTDANFFNLNNLTGAVTLKSAANYQAKPSYNFNVTVSDGTLTSTEAVTLNVIDVAPVIAPSASTTVTEGTTPGTSIYTANATSVVGSTITYALSGADASAFTINATTGVISVAPSAVLNYQLKSSYNLTVLASDGTDTSSQTLTVNLTDIAPVINSLTTISVAEGTPITTPVFSAVATDISGTTLTYTLSGADANLFNINSATGAVTLKAIANYQTQPIYNFNVTVSDGTLSTTEAVILNVTDVAPVIAPTASTTVIEGTAPGTTVYTASANSVVGSVISYALSGADASAFTINAATGAISIAPSQIVNYQTKSTYTLTVLAMDGTDTSIQTLTINVTDQAPIINSTTTTSVVAGSTINAPIFTATATDITGTTLTYSLAGADANLFNINSATGAVTLKSVANYQNKPSYNFSIVASDGTLTSSEAVTLNVTDIVPTIISPATVTVQEGTSTATAIYTVAGASVPGTVFTYALSGPDSAAFTINPNTGVVKFISIPNATLQSTYSISVTASDGTLTSIATPITINITDIAPVITSPSTLNVMEGTTTTTVVYTAAATDVIGTQLTYGLTGTDAALFTINSQTGDITFNSTPLSAVQSIYNVNVTASDGLKTSVQALTINIESLRAPSLTQTTPVTYAPNVVVDSMIQVSNPSNGTLVDAIVTIANYTNNGMSYLTFAPTGDTGNITGTYNVSTGELVLSSPGNTATVAQYQAALRSVEYTNNTTNAPASQQLITFVIDNGNAVNNLSSPLTAVINIPSTIVAPTPVIAATPIVNIPVTSTPVGSLDNQIFFNSSTLDMLAIQSSTVTSSTFSDTSYTALAARAAPSSGSSNSGPNIGGSLNNPVTVMFSKYTHQPSWGFEHTPDFVNLTPIVEGLSDTVATLSSKVAEPDGSSIVPSVNSQNTQSDDTQVAPVTKGDVAKALDTAKVPLTAKPTAENKANKVSESKVYRPLETANFAFSRRVNFQDRVKKLLSDFGMSDDGVGEDDGSA